MLDRFRMRCASEPYSTYKKATSELKFEVALIVHQKLTSYFLTLLLAEGIALLVVELLVGNALGLDEVEELAESAAFLSAALVFIRVA